jgi:hypothetical protein
LRPASGWCEARPNAAWRSALARGVVGVSRKVSIVPLAAGDDRSFFATIHTSSFAGVARINAQTNRVTRIKRFPDAARDQAFGSFDGRWLVWVETHSLYELNDFTVWAWDSRAERLMKIGAAGQGPQGSFWWSYSLHPAVRDGLATWEQGSGPNGIGDIHVFDLANGRDRIVRHGYAKGPVFVGDRLVVWPESARRHAPTQMHGADARTGRTARVPTAFRGLHGISAAVFATDGTAIAYPTGDYASLWWSPSPALSPMRLGGVGSGDRFDNSVQIAGRYVFFSVAPRAYLADTVTRRYLQVSAGGWGRLNEKAFVLLPPAKVKAGHPITDVLLLPLASLPPIPYCS